MKNLVVSVKISSDSIGDMVSGMFGRVEMVEYAQSCTRVMYQQEVGDSEVT